MTQKATRKRSAKQNLHSSSSPELLQRSRATRTTTQTSITIPRPSTTIIRGIFSIFTFTFYQYYDPKTKHNYHQRHPQGEFSISTFTFYNIHNPNAQHNYHQRHPQGEFSIFTFTFYNIRNPKAKHNYHQRHLQGAFSIFTFTFFNIYNPKAKHNYLQRNPLYFTVYTFHFHFSKFKGQTQQT